MRDTRERKFEKKTVDDTTWIQSTLTNRLWCKSKKKHESYKLETTQLDTSRCGAKRLNTSITKNEWCKYHTIEQETTSSARKVQRGPECVRYDRNHQERKKTNSKSNEHECKRKSENERENSLEKFWHFALISISFQYHSALLVTFRHRSSLSVAFPRVSILAVAYLRFPTLFSFRSVVLDLSISQSLFPCIRRL